MGRGEVHRALKAEQAASVEISTPSLPHDEPSQLQAEDGDEALIQLSESPSGTQPQSRASSRYVIACDE